jgi:hypothetical protein
MRPSPYALRTEEPRVSANADQVEFGAMRFISSVIDDAARDEIFSGELDDEAEIESSVEGDRHAWQQQDLAQEELVGSTLLEIKRRAEILGQHYPFEVIKNKLEYRSSSTGFYEFCLATACAPSITIKPYVVFPRIFERTVTGLVREYFGPHCSALHTGWPRTPKKRFKETMSRLAENKYEWVWSPEHGLDDDPPYVVVKDESVDFIITSRLMDQRPGNLYILGQCACGDDWDSKLEEPDLPRIRKWFSPPWIIPPIRAFTTPFVLGDETLREAARRSQSIVFDRIRLTLISEEILPHQIRTPMKRRMLHFASTASKS